MRGRIELPLGPAEGERFRQCVREDGIVIACGTARFTETDDSMAAVFERADTAMYENKHMLKKESGTAGNKPAVFFRGKQTGEENPGRI